MMHDASVSPILSPIVSQATTVETTGEMKLSALASPSHVLGCCQAEVSARVRSDGVASRCYKTCMGSLTHREALKRCHAERDAQEADRRPQGQPASLMP